MRRPLLTITLIAATLGVTACTVTPARVVVHQPGYYEPPPRVVVAPAYRVVAAPPPRVIVAPPPVIHVTPRHYHDNGHRDGRHYGHRQDHDDERNNSRGNHRRWKD